MSHERGGGGKVKGVSGERPRYGAKYLHAKVVNWFRWGEGRRAEGRWGEGMSLLGE